MKSQSIKVLNGTSGQFNKEIKLWVEDYVTGIKASHGVTDKSARYMFSQALASSLIHNEILDQIDFYIKNGLF